ncbi:MAG: MMPL family transporter, partial [Lachnospiraceae bacterium]|nr:MMPL family transporter [Lachnospiraceae bacterium]
SVFTFMPGLLMIFGPWMDKTKHKSFIPKIPFVGKYAYYTRFFVPPLFLFVVIAAMIVSSKCPYVYGYSTLTTPIKNEIQIADEMIEETFGAENFIAINVPRVNYETEGKLVKELEHCPEIDHIVALANTEAKDGYNLADKITARQFAEVMDVDYEVAKLLYTAYALNDENYAKLINDSSSYAIPFIDIVMFLYDEVKEGYVTLDDDVMEDLEEAHHDMQLAKDQLLGENYSRMLVYLNLPEEGDKTFNFLDEIHEIAHEYYEDGVLLAGESTSQYDLKKTFARDNKVVSIVSILAVLSVLLFTFMSVGMPILLIMVIQGSIWMNFSYPAIMHQNLFFMGYLIVSSIQMGANIDYAIVISGRFMELKDKMSKKEAIVETMNFAFPTIVTSGSMLALAGILIGQLTSDPTICGIGQCLGRGTIISIFLVMFVLPQILLLGEKIIDLSSFKVSIPLNINREAGLIRLDGVVQGNINGHFIGEMHGILRGDASILVATGTMQKMRDTGSSDVDMLEDKNAIDTNAEVKTAEETTDKNTADKTAAKRSAGKKTNGDTSVKQSADKKTSGNPDVKDADNKTSRNAGISPKPPKRKVSDNPSSIQTISGEDASAKASHIKKNTSSDTDVKEAGHEE